MPHPSSSIQPFPQTGQPTPSQRMHVTASSAPGSTNGKNAGPSFVCRSLPNSARATASSVPFRSAKVIPSSTTSPST